jgi:hypothetical protein
MKKLLLTLTISALALSACSKNDEVSTVDVTKEQTMKTVSAVQNNSVGLEGSWSFCHDKSLTSENVVESCTLYDTFLWQFDNEAITVGKVVDPLTTENCTTECYSALLSEVKVNNLANGFYTEENNSIIIDITDSKDLTNFPKCQVKWNIIDEADDQHQQWQLENVNCTTPIYNFKTWVKKVN